MTSKKRLYNSIMESVARVVRREINESYAQHELRDWIDETRGKTTLLSKAHPVIWDCAREVYRRHGGSDFDKDNKFHDDQLSEVIMTALHAAFIVENDGEPDDGKFYDKRAILKFMEKYTVGDYNHKLHRHLSLGFYTYDGKELHVNPGRPKRGQKLDGELLLKLFGYIRQHTVQEFAGAISAELGRTWRPLTPRECRARVMNRCRRR